MVNNDTSLLECRTIVNNMVKEVGGPNKASAKKLNPFNANKGFACPGAELASYNSWITLNWWDTQIDALAGGGLDTLSPATVSTSTGDQKTFGYVTIPRGNMIVFCDGIETIETHVRSPDASGFALRTCTCLQDDSEDDTLCRTTNRLQGKIFARQEGGGTKNVINSNSAVYEELDEMVIELIGPDDTLNVVPYALGTQKKMYVNGIGTIRIDFDRSYSGMSGGDNITVTIPTGGLTLAGISEMLIDNGSSVTVYLNDDKDCYTPQIDSDAGLLAGLNSDYHYCRK